MPFSSVLGASSVIKPGVCTSTTRPTVPYEGQLIYETDTDRVASYNGSAWVYTATSGMVLLKTETFTGVSAVSIQNVFSSTYDDYMLTFRCNGVTTASGIASLQFLVGSTATTTNYVSADARFYTTTGVEQTTNNLGTDEISFSVVGATYDTHVFKTFFVSGPQLATTTKVSSWGPGNFGGNALYWDSSMGIQTDNTQFNGIKFIFPGNTDGVVRVYGLSNS